VTGRADWRRMPELFVAGELLAVGGGAVPAVMLHEAAHALAVIRGIRDTRAEGNRYHSKRFAALATETGLSGPARPEKVTGWSDCRTTGETTAAYHDVIAAIDSARLPFLPMAARATATATAGEKTRAAATAVRKARPSRKSATAAGLPSSAAASRRASCT